MSEERIYRDPVFIENTKFIYRTNFSGNPENDKYKSTSKRGNVIIPDEQQALELLDAGYNVKQTRPRNGEEDGFVPTYYISVIIGYGHPKRRPHIYLVTNGGVPTELGEEDTHIIDEIYVKNVNITLHPHPNRDRGTWTMYVQTMYVEQNVDEDPWAERYQWESEEEE